MTVLNALSNKRFVLNFLDYALHRFQCSNSFNAEPNTGLCCRESNQDYTFYLHYANVLTERTLCFNTRLKHDVSGKL